jgi:hypothetical protein
LKHLCSKGRVAAYQKQYSIQVFRHLAKV